MKRKFLRRPNSTGGSLANVRYISLDGGYVNELTEAAAQNYIPLAGTLRKFYVVIDNAPGGGGNYVFTLNKNGNPTTITCTISDPGISGSDIVHEVAVSVGDLVCVSVTPSDSPAPTNTVGVSIVLEYDTGESESTCLCSIHPGLSLTTDYIPCAGEYESQALDYNNTIAFPCACVINELHVKLDTAPGGTTWRKFTVYVNGNPTDVLVQITGAATLATITGKTLDIAAGDKVCIRHTRSGAVVGSVGHLALVFTPDNAGEFVVATMQQYSSLTGGQTDHAGLSTSLTNTVGSPGSRVITLLNSDIKITGMSLYTNVAQGVGKSTVATLVKYSNGAEQTPTLQLTNSTGPVTDIFDWTAEDNTSYCTKIAATSGSTSCKPIVAYAMVVLDLTPPVLSGSVADVLPIPIDAIGATLQRVLTASVSDTMRVASDLLFPPAAIIPNLSAGVSDTLPVPTDSITVALFRHLSVNLSDTMKVIEDSVRAGKIVVEGPGSQGRWVCVLTIIPRGSR